MEVKSGDKDVQKAKLTIIKIAEHKFHREVTKDL